MDAETRAFMQRLFWRMQWEVRAAEIRLEMRRKDLARLEAQYPEFRTS